MNVWDRMNKAALFIDQLYQGQDIERLGRPWTLTELSQQTMVDWGELAEHIGKYEGFRPGEYDKSAAEHELGDLLWALMVISNRMDIDLQTAFVHSMDTIADRFKPTESAASEDPLKQLAAKLAQESGE